MPGVAAADAAQAKPETLAGPVTRDRFGRIGRAGREEATAAAEPRRHQIAVGANEQQQETGHRLRASSRRGRTAAGEQAEDVAGQLATQVVRGVAVEVCGEPDDQIAVVR